MERKVTMGDILVGVTVSVILSVIAALVLVKVSAPGGGGELAGAGVNVRTERILQVQNSIDNRGSLVQAGPATMGSTLDVTGNTSVTGTFSATGAASFSGNATVSGVLVGDKWVRITPKTAVVVSAGGIITPTGSYQPLTSAGVVTTSTSRAVADGASIGDLLILRNANASDAITVDGVGGNVECKADIALGPGDTITLIWNGSDWNCLANRDNS